MAAQSPFSAELQQNILDALHSYLDAEPLQDGRTPLQVEAELDEERVKIIDTALHPLLRSYFDGALPANEFKRKIDGINKQNKLWGFSGIKGQMFFNMLFKVASDSEEMEKQLKKAILEPVSEDAAVAALNNFASYVVRIGQKFVDAGGDKYSKPKPGSVPFFLSYFWQIQKPEIWPVFYTNSVQMIEAMNLWQESGDAGNDYIAYKHLHEALAKRFSSALKRPFSLYDVEHVFWFRSGKLLTGTSQQKELEALEILVVPQEASAASQNNQASQTQTAGLPDSYVPPIVEIIPKLALNDIAYQDLATRSGVKLERALEKSVHAAFTILGYETRLLGQGSGRVPDGQAIAVDEAYAVLWDAKARADGYKMGTDDRIIRQYIEDQSRALKKTRRIRNIYYAIISSGFADEFDDLIRSLKMETDVNEVCLIESTALVALVDQKLRSPLEMSLGPDGIQRLFSTSGRISAAHVSEIVG